MRDDGVITSLGSRKAEALLVYLASTQRAQAREVLADMFWDERSQSQALSNLRVILALLRKHFEPYLAITRESVALNADAGVWFDAAEFEEGLKTYLSVGPIHSEGEAELVERAIKLYQGEFLEGFYVRDSSRFEHWMVQERERLHQLALSALAGMVEYYLAGQDYQAGIAHAARLLELDPLMESGHRQMMHLLALSGKRALALKQYETLCQLLVRELGIAPNEKSQKLYEDIRDGRVMGAVPQPGVYTLSETRPRHNLQQQSTPFVGRDRELNELIRMLADRDSGFVSICAPGGMGKTRLALALAERQLSTGEPRDEYKDGVYFIELDSVDDPTAIVTAIARVTGYKFARNGRDSKQQVIDYLKDKQMLLVLDNFEHLLEGAPLVMEIRGAAPGVVIVTTTQQRLEQPGENLFHLSGMDFPNWETPEDAQNYEAVKLFMNSAQRTQPHFELTPDNVNYVARICRLVGGMPLGIVLAASWLAILSPQEVAEEIQQGIDILEAASGDVEDRHQSIRAVFDKSWSLMQPGEQQVFAQLSVFRGGFTREAVQEITGVDLRTLMGLVNKSLIRRRVSTGRFEIHELLRQYAQEKLTASGASAGVRDTHAAYFADFVAERELDAGKFSQKEIADSIDADFENIRTAWSWSLERHHFDLLLKIVITMWVFVWLRQSRFDEVIWLYEKAIARLDGLEEPGARQALNGRVLTCLASMISARRVEKERAERLARQGLEMSYAAGDELGQALGQNVVAFESTIEDDGDRLAEALNLLDESIQGFLKLGRVSLAGNSQWVKVLIQWPTGIGPHILEELRKSTAMFHQSGINGWNLWQ